MPAKSTRAPARQQTPRAPSAANTDQDPAKSNAEEAEKARTKEGTAAGLANYQATLGSWLGAELYGAVASQLTLDKLGGFADQGYTSALKSLVGLLDKSGAEIEDGALDAFADALAENYATTASEWLKGDGKGVADSLAGWVDANPKLIVTTALLAAAGAIAANMDIPELKQKFGIADGLDAEISAKLGKLRDISLQKITAKLSYTAGPLVAAFKASYEDGGAVAAEASATLGDDERNLRVEGKFTEDDLELYGVSGLYKTDDGTTLQGSVEGSGSEKPTLAAAMEKRDGDVISNMGVDYDLNTATLTIKQGRKLLLDEDGGSFSVNHSASSDGTQTAAVAAAGATGIAGLSGKASLESVLKHKGVGSAYELDETDKVSLGFNYTRTDLQAELDAWIDSKGGGGVTGSVKKDLGDNYSAGGNASFDLGDNKLTEVGAFYGFRDPNEFKTWMARYAYREENHTHDMGLLIEEKLGQVYGRFEQKVTLSDLGLATETSAHGAYFLNDDVAAIAGARWQMNERGEHDLIPEAGVQVKGVPLTVGYSSRNKGVMLRLSIPFGR